MPASTATTTTTTANGNSKNTSQTSNPNSTIVGPSGQVNVSTEALQAAGLDPIQLMNLMNSYPHVLQKLAEDGNMKENAAQTLAIFHAQAQQAAQQQMQYATQPHPAQYMEPGPSSHPLGPPGLGASPQHNQDQQQEAEEGSEGDSDKNSKQDNNSSNNNNTSPAQAEGTTTATGGRSRSRGGAAMGSDEWSRQRKDNHKEVERRRRGNINEGINELGRIVPNGSGEKAKGAILSRAVQYIHHLKENEARNIEKWTLEKLLMDQAMGDLGAQLEEVRRLWDEQRLGKQRAEAEIDVLREKIRELTGGDGGSGINENGKRSSPAEDEKEGKRLRSE